ncbi:hypothetical protein DFP72DRAFT_1049202 [Ephemerocybe angulata]|uniref:DUF6533 domain-containing protein n=1 Tax=Ephemerocybe angulata TaxID=980116 RepID=A0A8H6HM14_9AGAR|nr:hypothetical protein DFP72DRAFT_1049202 [Tulosesus angulatus]
MVTTIIQKYFTASCLTLLVYDYALTFEAEVTTIWTSPWSTGIPLFYFGRYLPIIDEAMLVYYGRSTESAKGWRRWEALPVMVASLAVIVLTALQGITIFFLGAYDQPLAPTPGCRLMSRKAPYLQGIYATGVAAEAVTVVLMLARGLQHVRQSKDSWVFSLYGTGILYCVVILILGIANVVLLSLPTMVGFATILAPLQHAMKSILCSRLMFAILKRRNMAHRNTVRNLDLSIEQSRRVRNVGEQWFTSIEEYPRRTVDVIELQASEGESTGSYNTRAYGFVGSPDPPQVELSR